MKTPISHGGEPMFVGEDDDSDRRAGGHEVARGDHPDRRAEERDAPEVREALSERRAGAALALLLKPRAHEQERRRRERVRRGVREERQPAGELKEQTSERRRAQPDDRHPGHRDARGVGELRLRDDRFHRPARACAVHDRGAHVHECDDENEPVARVAGEHRRPEDCERGRAGHVRENHEPLAIEAVGGDARRNRQEDERSEFDRADVSGLRGGIRQRKREQRIRDPRNTAAEGRQELACLEQDEVAVAPQGEKLAHASIVAATRAGSPVSTATSGSLIFSTRRVAR